MNPARAVTRLCSHTRTDRNHIPFRGADIPQTNPDTCNKTRNPSCFTIAPPWAVGILPGSCHINQRCSGVAGKE